MTKRIAVRLFVGAAVAVLAFVVFAQATAHEAVFIAVYERGAKYDASKPIFEQNAVREHIVHHEALGARLVAAGPFRPDANSELAGAVVFKAANIEAAREWLNADPAIVAGTLRGSVMQWRVSRIAEYQRAKQP